MPDPPTPDPPWALRSRMAMSAQHSQLLTSEFAADKVVTQVNYMVIER